MKLDDFFFTQGGGFIQHSPIKVHNPKDQKYDGEQTNIHLFWQRSQCALADNPCFPPTLHS
jgi:hypothetical protein